MNQLFSPTFYRVLYSPFLLLVISMFSYSSYAQQTDHESEITLLFAGDIMQHGMQLEAAKTKTGFDYSPNYTFVRPIIQQADIAIGNLELTLAGKPYSGYPTFSANDQLADALKRAGFDFLVTANNHSLDRRKKGLERTIDILNQRNIPHTGTFKDSIDRSQRYPAIIEKKGFRIALLNYTYGTNGIPVTPPNIVNYIDRNVIEKDIAKAKISNPDIIICFLHWGSEYRSLPNQDQKDLQKWLKSKGVGLIIGSHPHVIQPVIQEENHLTAYSLGNFISNQRSIPRDGGMMLEVKLKKLAGKTQIEESGYYLVWVYRKETPSRQFYIIPEALSGVKTSVVTEADQLQKMEDFLTDSRILMTKESRNIREIRSFQPLDYLAPFGWKIIAAQGDAEKSSSPYMSTQPDHEPAEQMNEAAPSSKRIQNEYQRSFAIQFFAGKNRLSTEDFPEKWKKSVTEIKKGELYKYQIGGWKDRQEAEEALKVIRMDDRYTDAFIVIIEPLR